MACDADAIVNAYSRGRQPACRKGPSASLREFATRSCDCSSLKFSRPSYTVSIVS